LRRCLGLDIGSEVIKLVELQKKGKDAVLYTAAQTPTPPHGFSKGRVSDLEGLKKALRHLLDVSGHKTENVVLGITNQDVLIRKVTMPPMPEKELAASLDFEIEDIFNLTTNSNTSSVVYSYDVLNRTEKELEIIVVGCYRDLIDPYIELLNSVGLVPHVFDIAAFSLPHLYKQDNICFVDLGAHQTTIYAEINNQYAVHRVLPVGGVMIDEGISQAFEVDISAAKQLKNQNDLDYLLLKGAGSKNLLRSVIQQYIGGIFQTLDYLRAQLRASAISEVMPKVVLCGGNANLMGFDQILAQELGVAIEICNPFSAVSLTEARKLPDDAAIYSNAVGLALRGLAE